MTRQKTEHLRESLPRFCDAFGISLYPWQREIAERAFVRVDGRFPFPIVGVSLPRGNGKTRFDATVLIWILVTGEEGETSGVSALNIAGTKATIRAVKEILRECPDLAKIVKVGAEEIRVPVKDSRAIVTSREHTSGHVRGPHLRLCIYDEAGHTEQMDLFTALLAGQASVTDPCALLTSTVGFKMTGPLWRLKELHEAGDPNVFYFHTHENLSPKVTTAYLERQRGILSAFDYAREHENTWVDDASAIVQTEDVDACMGHGWREQTLGKPEKHYVCAVDLGTVSDPSVVSVGHLEDDDGAIYIDRIVVVKGEKKRPVSLVAIEEIVRQLDDGFKLAQVKIESWQGLMMAERLVKFGRVPAEILEPTLKTQMREWPLLSQRITDRMIVFPFHPLLRRELLGLTWEATSSGMKVVARDRAHQDVAVTVRMIVAMLEQGGSVNPEIAAPVGIGRRTFIPFGSSPAPMRDPTPNAYGEGDDLQTPWASGGRTMSEFGNW